MDRDDRLSGRGRPAGPVLLELAKAAAEACVCPSAVRCVSSRRRRASSSRTSRPAPPVLTLVELPLALAQKLLARGDRIGMVGELTAGAQERLLRRAKLVEAGLDLGKASLVGIARNPLSSSTARSRASTCARRASSSFARVSSAAARSARAGPRSPTRRRNGARCPPRVPPPGLRRHVPAPPAPRRASRADRNPGRRAGAAGRRAPVRRAHA